MVCLVPKSGTSKNGSDTARKGNGNGNGGGPSGGEEFEPWQVMVKPGYILGPYGDEIHIDCTRVIDLRSRGVTGVTGELCVEAADPWCSEVFEYREAEKLYIAVRYKEVATRPVRVQPVGCCDDNKCEYSRLKDGYEIAVLDYCPNDHEDPPDRDEIIGDKVPDCPECPDEPWVGLASVTLDPDTSGRVKGIDNCECRRMVISFADFWWQCHAEADTQSDIRVDKLSMNEFAAGVRNQAVTLSGQNLDKAESVSFGDRIQVTINKAEPAALEAAVSIPADISGSRDITVTPKDHTGKPFVLKNAITIKGQQTMPEPEPKPQPQPGPKPRTPRGGRREGKEGR